MVDTRDSVKKYLGCIEGNLGCRTSLIKQFKSRQASLRIAGKAKCYYVYVQHSRTGALTSLKVRLKQYLSITYANPEPMLKTESNDGTNAREQFMTLVS